MEQSHGLDELNRTVIAQGRCAACGACVNLCPYLMSFRGKTVVMDKCTVAKGRCFHHCPMTFFDSDAVKTAVFGETAGNEALGSYRRVLGARAWDIAVASAGQGGGVVSALMIMALESGIIDAAVLTRTDPEGGFPHGVVATSGDEILACSGSKFVGAHSLAALRDALDQGFQRIGVVGLPCQVRSIRKMALYDIRNENLRERIQLVIGLFCNWAFSSREFQAFLDDRFGSNTVRRFDIPPPPAGALELTTDEGLVSLPLDEVRRFIQPACNVCPDMTAEFADLSVGMYEGKPGWNTLIERTAMAHSLIEKASAQRVIEVEGFRTATLEHLASASAQKRRRASQT